MEPIRIGDPFEREYNFETSPGVPRDLTGSTFTWNIRGHTSMLSFSVTVPDPASGSVPVALTGTQTSTLYPNNAAEAYLVETISGVGTAKAHTTERVIPRESAE